MTRILFASVLMVVAVGSNVRAQAPDKIQGKTAAEWVEILKTHKELKFRRVALIVLEVYGPRTDGVLPAVTDALERDAEPQIRREAAMLLGRMGADAKGSIFALGDALRKDAAEPVREAAAQALGSRGLNPFAVEQVMTLAEALNDPHAGTRTAAAEAILKLGDKAAPALPALTALAKDAKKDRFSRQYALKCLGRLGADQRDTAIVLIGVLRDKDAPLQLREEAAEGLGRSSVAAEFVVQPLGETLADPAVELRRAVAAALAKQGKYAGAAWPKIAAALKSSDDQAVRYQLIRVTGQLAKAMPPAEHALIQHASKDPHIENRLAAIQELGELGANMSDAIQSALTDIAENDTTAAIRTAADSALKKLQGM
ncbi:MAG: HEAT repeat domain-containing protein [Planctomycetota bacterium]